MSVRVASVRPHRLRSVRPKRQRGAFAVIFAISAPVLIAAVGMGFDIGGLYLERVRVQTAADAAAREAGAALAAGASLTEVPAVTAITTSASTPLLQAVRRGAAQNGFDVANVGVTLTAEPVAGQSQQVRVSLSTVRQNLFLQLIGPGSSVVSARATGSVLNLPNCLYVLSSSVNDVSVTGQSIATANCAANFGAAQNQFSSQGISAINALKKNPAVTVDPLASLPALTPGSTCMTGQPVNNEFSPGTYCNGLSLTSGGPYKFKQGTYHFIGSAGKISGQDYSLIINGPVTVTGLGPVTFHFVSGSSGPNNYAFNPFYIGGKAQVTLSAPTTGNHAGILFFQSASAGTISGNSNSRTRHVVDGGTGTPRTTLNLSGTLYLRKSEIELSGGAQLTTSSYNPIVINSLSLKSSGSPKTTLTLAADFSTLPGNFALRSGTNLATTTLVD